MPMFPKPRKNSEPASAADLRDRIATVRATIQHCDSESDRGEKLLPEFVGDDGLFWQTQTELKNLQEEGQVARRMLPILESALVEAEQREARAKVEARRDAQRRKSEKLRTVFERRFRAAAQDLVAILQDIDADEAECQAVSAEAREHGLTGVWGAEYASRKDLRCMRDGFASVTRARIPSWDGEWLWHRGK